MIQALVKKGKVKPVEVPAPLVSSGGVLIKVVNSCISTGTELTSVQNSKSMIRKALEQPENVRKVLNLTRSEGISRAWAKIRGKLEGETATGYSLSGVILAVGEGVTDLQVGDRVTAAGAGIANHAEYVDVPRNLVMRMPDGLGFKEASTVTLGGIAMQGVRRAQVQLGEFVVVFGAGNLGQLAIQMLIAACARVIVVDVEPKRLDIAENMGAEPCLNPNEEDCIRSILHYTNGHGADVVLYCAATTDSQALSDAFAMCRKKGRVVMLGIWGRELKREDIYTKELDFLISTSYGPGRYDPLYEEKGLDYPYAYVRWTENRNMEEYLRLLASEKIKLDPLIQTIFPIDQVQQAFECLQGSDPPLMVLLDYGQEGSKEFSNLIETPRKLENKLNYKLVPHRKIRVGIIGAGNFAVSMHLPNLQKLKNRYEILAICNRTGSKARSISRQFGAKYSTTNYKEILSDSDIDLVMICTRHNLHGRIVLESLQAGKHTFVEKPLCTTQEELEAIKSFYGLNNFSDHQNSQLPTMPLLMVGFNRRFSKYAREMKKHVSKRINPLFIHYRMNAGYLPLDHWVHTEEGGGRIIGEACHAIDLCSYLIGSPLCSFASASLRPKTSSITSTDNKSIVMEYEDGSVATLQYFSVGSSNLPKEYLELDFDEKTITMDDYKSVEGHGLQVAGIKTSTSSKGQIEELECLAAYLTKEKEDCPIPLESLIETTQLTIDLSKSF